MNPIFKSETKGIILYMDSNVLYKSINNKLYQSFDNGRTWQFKYEIRASSFLDMVTYSRHLSCRLLRKGIHHLGIVEEDKLGLLYDRKAAVLSNTQLMQICPIKGSRPLSFEFVDREFMFGEYRSNPERSAIAIYGFNSTEGLYKKLEMNGIRHIHGIYQDPFTKNVWITTGDDDDESALYCTDPDFKTLDKIIYGSQQTRTIKLLFTEDAIYFGSDAPDERNFLYKMDKGTLRVEKLVGVGSSVFHGYRLENWLFFSTAVEPSKINNTKNAELWASPNGADWKCILTLKKDLWPMRYFQYGQIFFPAGPGNGKDLWFSGFGTEYSNRTFKVKVDDLMKLF